MTNLLPKYNVFKIDDAQNTDPLPQGEFFVLRKQDVLAVHALWAYVQVLALASDLLSTNQSLAMTQLADQVSDLAYEWQDEPTKKLPD